MFNVILYDVNHKRFIPYNIIPYLKNTYKERKKKLTTFEQFKEFVKKESQYQFWSRCQYEIILKDWPCEQVSEKWDVYDQIIMNLDTVTKILMECVKK